MLSIIRPSLQSTHSTDAMSMQVVYLCVSKSRLEVCVCAVLQECVCVCLSKRGAPGGLHRFV